MEYVGYAICAIAAFFALCFGWKTFEKTLSRWHRSRMSEWTFLKKRLGYAISLAVTVGIVPSYIIHSHYHPEQNNRAKQRSEQEKYQPIESATTNDKSVEHFSPEIPQEIPVEDTIREENEEQTQDIQEETYENKIEAKPKDSVLRAEDWVF